jgi:large subunit ribosomal protein L6
MTRISKIAIIVPEKVNVTLDGKMIKVAGTKGELMWVYPEKVTVKFAEGKLAIGSEDGAGEINNLLGLTHSLVSNMVKGVVEGWTRTLELNGTGYRANVAGTDLNLALGFSHPVLIPAPAGVAFEVKENKIFVRGADKSLVGETAAKIRSLRPADPYKGKGFKYEGEVLIKKAGKAAKAGASAAAK